MTTARKALRVGVIGPAGFGGSYLCVELIARGHSVVGMSRNPQKLGTHNMYHPQVVDANQATISESAKAFADVEVLVAQKSQYLTDDQIASRAIMSTYTIHDSEFQNLRDKVIVITGAATGIGRATAHLAHRHGAKVAVCDVNEEKGKEMEHELKENILFRKCDVSNWQSVLAFFLAVYDFFGPIDAVISNAAISKVESFDDGDITTENLKAPDMSVLNVNTTGSFYITKCAVHFFKKHPKTPSQLVLFGSVASFFDTPPLYTYCASKAAILGLMRALRTQLPKDNITVNMIAPWMTVTPMVTDHIRTIWGDLPANSTADVAVASLLPAMRPYVNGKSLLVNGGIITELEDKLDETQSVWLGPELDKNMREGQRRLIP